MEMANFSKSTLGNAEKKSNRLCFHGSRCASLSSQLGNLIYDPVVLFVPAELVSYLCGERYPWCNQKFYKRISIKYNRAKERIDRRESRYLCPVIRARCTMCINRKVVLHISPRFIIFRFIFISVALSSRH